MNKNDTEFLVQKIRTQYTEKETSEIDKLKKLDSKVKKPVNVFAYVFGCISAIIMGSGMSLVMTEIGEALGIEHAMVIGIVIGIIGLLFAIVNIPMHKKLLAARKKKYADEIIALINKILNN